MAKLVLVLFCCFVWAAADPFFFNIQKSYVSQPTQTTSRPVVVSQSTNVGGTGGIFSKWWILSNILTNKLVGAPTQRPRPTQRPVIQIDPVYKPVDLDKEYASTTTTEVPAEEIVTTKKSTTSTTSSYEYPTSSTSTEVPVVEIETTKKSTTSTTSSYEYPTPSTTASTTTTFSFSESTSPGETFKPTTYRPTTSSTTQGSTTPTTSTTTTTEKSEAEIGYEIDSSEQDKPNEIIEPLATSTTTQESTEGVASTEATVSLPLTYLPPVIKDRRVPTASVGLAATGSISSGVLSANAGTGFRFSSATGEVASEGATPSGAPSAGGNARPFNIASFRGSIADDIAGEGVIEEAKSVEVGEFGINPRVFYYY